MKRYGIGLVLAAVMAAGAQAQQPAWQISSLGREGENRVPSASILGGPRLYAVTVTCVRSENALLFIDSATNGLKNGAHEITLSIGDRSAKTTAQMDTRSLLFGQALTFSLPLANPFAAPATQAARVVISSGEITRDWGEGAADAITQVAAACAAKPG